MALREIIWKAYDLFSNPGPYQSLENPGFFLSLKNLINLTSRLQAVDIGLNEHMLEHLGSTGKDPIWYMSIVDAHSDELTGERSSDEDSSATSEEDENLSDSKQRSILARFPQDPASVMTVAAFVVKPGERLPLHDHPKMYGILKVLHGRFTVQAYSSVKCLAASPGHSIPQLLVEKHPIIQVTPDSAPLLLHKNSQDVHEISNDSDTVGVFLDILAPPYDFRVPDDIDTEHGHRNVTYYRDIERDNSSKSNKFYAILEEIPCPSWYKTAHMEYPGPPLRD